MNRDHVDGGLRHLKGRGKTALGAIAGNPRRQVEGALDQVAGAVQYAYGEARGTAHGLRRDGRHLAEEAGERGRAVIGDVQERGRHARHEAARRGREALHKAEENKAVTLLLVAAAAFGAGWLLRRAR